MPQNRYSIISEASESLFKKETAKNMNLESDASSCSTNKNNWEQTNPG